MAEVVVGVAPDVADTGADEFLSAHDAGGEFGAGCSDPADEWGVLGPDGPGVEAGHRDDLVEF
ncbi:hypothetical protein [Actinoplanes derwentensis]|uniref:hypothetical protein n=1 Tax=Actinoplanes derwentensis TaxID=113562 RepID=UPI0012FE0903|nr:hypothetical protein [Actinoplanes derwentensis]